VTVKGQAVYVCCPQCAAKLRAAPDAYLAKATAERSGRATALPATTPSGPYAGQKTCPVTGEELDPAGGAIPVAVRGQTIYVCCAGCAAKVKNDPEPYLNKVLVEHSAR
jgi:YHS domain-containing protein